MRTVVFGDLHGCVRPLDALLDRIMPDETADRLIFLGDLFDRGPDSWEVWQRIMQLQQTFGERLVLLQGNHEDYWLEKKPTLSLKMLHHRVGRGATVRSFRQHGAVAADCLPWLERSLVPYCREEAFQCVHAGVRVEPLQANDRYTLIHDHEAVLQNRYQGRLTITGHLALPEACLFEGDGESVCMLQPGKTHHLPEKGVLCIDTGCGKGGKLTAMIVEDLSFRLEQKAEG